MKMTEALELDPLAFVLDHPQLNTKPCYDDIPVENRPYGELDFLFAAVSAILAFNDRSKWIYYYQYCNTLFVSDRLTAIHKAKSMSALMVVNDFRFLLAEFCSDADEVVFSKILPFVSRNLSLHEEHSHETIEQFKKTVQYLTKTLLVED